jgi:hypothetical protein
MQRDHIERCDRGKAKATIIMFFYYTVDLFMTCGRRTRSYHRLCAGLRAFQFSFNKNQEDEKYFEK